jgi:hypothetical protein
MTMGRLDSLLAQRMTRGDEGGEEFHTNRRLPSIMPAMTVVVGNDKGREGGGRWVTPTLKSLCISLYKMEKRQIKGERSTTPPGDCFVEIHSRA